MDGNTPTYGEYDITAVEGFDGLMVALREINEADDYTETVERVAEVLLNGHEGSAGYLTFGNNKVAKNVGIFNMNSATDCPNAATKENGESETGLCQVPWGSCYAHKAEVVFPGSLPKRRRQEYFWDNIDAQTFADALLRVKERKTAAFDYLRVSESGDFRSESDIIKWNIIARELSDEIQVYTYSASHKLDWSDADAFTVNQSNSLAEYGDREFNAVMDAADIPDDAILCPYEAAKRNGLDNDSRPKCGDCTHCIEPASEQPRDVYVLIH